MQNPQNAFCDSTGLQRRRASLYNNIPGQRLTMATPHNLAAAFRHYFCKAKKRASRHDQTQTGQKQIKTAQEAEDAAES
jgi:hypothetical protein